MEKSSDKSACQSEYCVPLSVWLFTALGTRNWHVSAGRKRVKSRAYKSSSNVAVPVLH
ncbi:Hypothetical protein PHPALM_13113 [Phytophthora palmivora]|uniref:Uncharacterized protein n=1 Tax=Phytophthora palmivora TaxID=4796 RepID=A0A2P4XY00_9STRA|nr:Hypothetical protein PHPALM_13113 [Phytophthora palmivora]